MNEANGGSVIYHIKADKENFDKNMEGVKGVLGKVGKTATVLGTAVAGVSTAVGGALAAVAKQSLEAYADVEQSIGGVETLFGDSAQKVIENAQQAYKTAGVDANTYMQGVTSFAASLLQATGNNAEEAANISDMAFRDMSDNANKFGTDMQSIQNAYQSFARGQYQLLDNLKLGYGGTKGEMERLLADAEKISGVKYDISNLADVYNAIHVIQGELGVTGTTAQEAMSTISGSVNAAKMAFQNFISGQGGIDEVVETVTQAGINISQKLIEIVPRVAEGIVGIINGLIPMIPDLLEKLLPVFISGTVSIMQGLVEALPSIITVLSGMLPTIITTLLQGFREISQTLIDNFPIIVPAIMQGFVDTIVAIAENADMIIEGAIAMTIALAQGLIEALPILIQQAPHIIAALVGAIINSIPAIFDAGVNLIRGLWNGIVNMKDWVINKVKNLASGILNGIKSVLGIHSPSTEFAFVGKMSVLGYTEQLDAMKKDLDNAIEDTFTISPQLMNTAGLHYSPNVVVNNQMNMTTDPLGQVVGNIKTFANGSKNDYNYGMGV